MQSSINYFTQIQIPTLQEATTAIDVAETPEVFNEFSREIVKLLSETPHPTQKDQFLIRKSYSRSSWTALTKAQRLKVLNV